MSPDFSITTRHIPDVHIVVLHGELDIVSAYDFALALVDVAGSTVVVDLSDLTFMDSTGIAALVMAWNRIRADGLGELVLTRPGGIVAKALEIVGLKDGSWIGRQTGMANPSWEKESFPKMTPGSQEQKDPQHFEAEPVLNDIWKGSGERNTR